MSTAAAVAAPWFTREYLRMSSVVVRGDNLLVDFEDGTQAIVATGALVTAHGKRPRWADLKFSPYDIVVPADGGDVEIPWDLIRSLSDEAFAAHMAAAAEEQQRKIGRQLQGWRQHAGLSLEALAALAELAPETVSLIERGEHEVHFPTLERILRALGRTFQDFSSSPG